MHTLFEPTERGFLLTDIGRLIHKVFEQRASALGYSRPQWRILAYLGNNPGMMQAQLAERMEIEPITLSRHLDRMETEGVLERRGDPRDRRVKRLFLTEKADKQLVELRAVRDDIVNAIMVEIPEKEVEHLRTILSGVRRNLMEKLK